jgi:hypothetical protein
VIIFEFEFLIIMTLLHTVQHTTDSIQRAIHKLLVNGVGVIPFRFCFPVIMQGARDVGDALRVVREELSQLRELSKSLLVLDATQAETQITICNARIERLRVTLASLEQSQHEQHRSDEGSAPMDLVIRRDELLLVSK